MTDDASCPGSMARPAVCANAQDPRAADVAVETARIAAVIPALDEALAIAEVVRCARALRHPLRPEPLFAEVIVVDNGSHDDTGARAVAAGAKVVRGAPRSLEDQRHAARRPAGGSRHSRNDRRAMARRTPLAPRPKPGAHGLRFYVFPSTWSVPLMRYISVPKLSALVLIAAATLPTALHASGSIGFEGSSGQGSELYNQGKKVVHQQVLCKSCPLAGKTLDATLARRLIDDSSLTPGLDAAEREALAAYLTRRFKL